MLPEPAIQIGNVAAVIIYIFKNIRLVFNSELTRIIMYPNWMFNLLLYFDLWGFCSQFKRYPNQTKYFRLILALHTLLATVATVFISQYLAKSSKDKLGTINDILKFSFLLLVYWLSIFELYLKRRNQKQFWYITDYIDREFCSFQRFNLGYYPLKVKIYFSVSAIFTTFYHDQCN